MRNLVLLALSVVLSCAPAARAGELPSVDEVLDRFVEAVGGEEAFEGIDVRQIRGTIVQDLTWGEPPHQETPFIVRSDTWGRVFFAESDSWADLPALDKGEPGRKLRWIFHPRFALVVREFFPDLVVVERQVRDGRRVVVLASKKLDFSGYALYFDEESGLLSHVGYHNDLVGWHDVGGVQMPRRWVFGRKGGHTSYVFEEISAEAKPGWH